MNKEVSAMSWLVANKGTILVGTVVLLIVVWIIKNMYRKKKQGKSCSCGDGCGSCGGSCH